MTINYSQLTEKIKHWGLELGFQQVGICDIDLSEPKKKLNTWLEKNYHGEMAYMQNHAQLRAHPEKLLPGTKTVIVVRMDYLPPNACIKETLLDRTKAFISRYALGRDYHKVIRKRLEKLADKITEEIGEFNYRCFADSAPIMEKPLAKKAGLGWQGKHTNILNKKAGSWFFLGTLYTNLDLVLDEPEKDHCGSCTACIDICPTQAIVAPYQLDARRCISYLTIELRGSIPIEFRKLIGNRVYGCDDCQLVCPWNRFAKSTSEQDFHPRYHLDTLDLIDAFNWSETEFLEKTTGSAIKRIGYECWLRNMAVGLGNAPTCAKVVTALQARLGQCSEMVNEHIEWALQQHTN